MSYDPSDGSHESNTLEHLWHSLKLAGNIRLPPFLNFSQQQPAAPSPKLIGENCILFNGHSHGDQGSSLQNVAYFYIVGGLGEGGYATVVAAQKVDSGANYAIKVIGKRSDQVSLKKQEQQLKTEYDCMKRIEFSPFVQTCHFAFEDALCTYFVLELIEGGDLHTHLQHRLQQDQTFSEQEVRILLAELYIALEHLHMHNFIHRDIKVENVMLDAGGHVKLIDFGVAMEITQQVVPMSTAGSLIYMAPELIVEHTGGRHTDWWAYGVLAHELLTGNSPWSSSTNNKVIRSEIIDMKKKLAYPDTLSDVSILFISSLMCRNVDQRLGTKADTDIRKCLFFESIDWEKRSSLQAPPAFLPNLDTEFRKTKQAREKDEALQAYHRITRKSWLPGGF